MLSYRQDGTKRLYTIRQYGNITLEQAREIGRKRFGEVADGKDPAQIRKAKKKKHEWTVKKAFDDFLKKYAQERNKRWKETQRIFKKDILPILGHKPLVTGSLEAVTSRQRHSLAEAWTYNAASRPKT